MAAVPDPEEHIFEALLTVVVADEHVDPDEVAVLARVYEELTGRAVETATIEARAEARLQGDDPTAMPPGLSEVLDDEAKRRTLSAALAIAEADGFVLEEEDELLLKLSQALGLSAKAYREAAEGREAG